MRPLTFSLLILLPLASCQRSPTGRRQLALASDEQMDQMGRQAFAQMKEELPIERDPGINAYVRCVAGAIVNIVEPKREWEVVVFRKDEPNAFALPGGKIGVHSGMMKVARSQSQMGAVLGHEVGHVLAEHGKERASEQLVAHGGLAAASAILAGKEGGTQKDLLLAALGIGAQLGILLPHSRAQESEADHIGLDLMAQAGFEPSEAVTLWRNMEAAGGGQPPEFLSTHPANERRIADLQAQVPRAEKERQASPHRPGCTAPGAR